MINSEKDTTSSEKRQEQDLHQSEKTDPDPNQSDADFLNTGQHSWKSTLTHWPTLPVTKSGILNAILAPVDEQSNETTV